MISIFTLFLIDSLDFDFAGKTSVGLILCGQINNQRSSKKLKLNDHPLKSLVKQACLSLT